MGEDEKQEITSNTDKLASTNVDKSSDGKQIYLNVIAGFIVIFIVTVLTFFRGMLKEAVKDYLEISNLQTQVDSLATTVENSDPKLQSLEETIKLIEPKVSELEKNKLNYVIKDIIVNTPVGKYEKKEIAIDWTNQLKEKTWKDNVKQPKALFVGNYNANGGGGAELVMSVISNGLSEGKLFIYNPSDKDWKADFTVTVLIVY